MAEETHVPVFIELGQPFSEPLLIGGAIIKGDDILVHLVEGRGREMVHQITEARVLGISIGFAYTPAQQLEQFNFNEVATPPAPITGRFNTDYLKDPH